MRAAFIAVGVSMALPVLWVGALAAIDIHRHRAFRRWLKRTLEDA